MKLSPIIRTVLFGTRQNSPSRGHRDDSKHYETLDNGTFQARLDFRVDSDDVILKEHFATAPRNATYRSRSTQNDIIYCCADVANGKIMSEIRQSKHISILADELTGYSNKEQMPIVRRYVDSDNSIKERFICSLQYWYNWPSTL